MDKRLRILLFSIAILAITLLVIPNNAHAGMVDLSTANSSGGPVNGAYFSQGVLGASGSGKLAPFVRINTNNPQEKGYNTDGRKVPFDENSSPTFTHSLLLGHVPIVTRTDTQLDYYEFLLDINEANSLDKRYLSLDVIRIYLGTVGNLTINTVPPNLGELVYNLDAGEDSWILLNGHNTVDSGSGRADMVAQIPKSLFDNAVTEGKYVYLYSHFGGTSNATYPITINNGGFEEWGVEKNYYQNIIPEPATMLLFGAGLFGFGVFKRRGR